MKYDVYCIRDIKVGFMTPTVDLNDNTAMRNFEHAIASGNNLYSTHGKDFDLYKIGEFDTDSGFIDALVPAELIMSGSSV